MRHIGVDLHKTNFVVCFLNEDDTSRLETFPLSKVGIGRFTEGLKKDDALAVEVTQNIYYFYDQIKAFVGRAVPAMVNRTNTPLMSFYQKKKREKGSGKAICATARKLLTIVFVMFKKELDYWYLEERLHNRKLRQLNAAS